MRPVPYFLVNKSPLKVFKIGAKKQPQEKLTTAKRWGVKKCLMFHELVEKFDKQTDNTVEF